MPETNQQTPETFATMLARMNGGIIDEQATRELKKLVDELTQAARNTGGKPKGKLVLTINFKLDRGAMDVEAKTIMTGPAKELTRAIMYPTRDGLLSENDTRQYSFDMAGKAHKDVSTPGASNIRSLPDFKDIKSAQANDR